MNEKSEKITCSSLSWVLEIQQNHGRCPIIWNPRRYAMKAHHCAHDKYMVSWPIACDFHPKQNTSIWSGV